jgi:hypothetical protein
MYQAPAAAARRLTMTRTSGSRQNLPTEKMEGATVLGPRAAGTAGAGPTAAGQTAAETMAMGPTAAGPRAERAAGVTGVMGTAVVTMSRTASSLLMTKMRWRKRLKLKMKTPKVIFWFYFNFQFIGLTDLFIKKEKGLLVPEALFLVEQILGYNLI